MVKGGSFAIQRLREPRRFHTGLLDSAIYRELRERKKRMVEPEWTLLRTG